MKKGEEKVLGTVISAILLLILLASIVYIMWDNFGKVKNSINPVMLATQYDSCRADSKGINDLDMDGLDNHCDPCIDAKDGAEFDKNGNYMADECEELSKSTSQSVVCKYILHQHGKPLKPMRCCVNPGFPEVGIPGYECIQNPN